MAADYTHFIDDQHEPDGGLHDRLERP